MTTGTSAPFELSIVQPPVDAETKSAIVAIFVTEGASARDSGLETFLQSADPPCHVTIYITQWEMFYACAAYFAGKVAKIAIDDAAKATYEGIKKTIQSIPRAISKVYSLLKKRSGRETYFSLSVISGKQRIKTYELPAIDLEAALLEIFNDLQIAVSLPEDATRFWNDGRWEGVTDHRRRRGIYVPDDSGTAYELSLELLEAAEGGLRIFGAPIRYSASANRKDVLVGIPAESSKSEREEFLTELRSAMPGRRIGITPDRLHIFVENAIVDSVDQTTE